MSIQIVSRYSVLRPAGKILPALYLAIAIVICSLMPIALPTAWGGELQDDSRVWGAALARGNFGYVSPDLKRWLWWMEGQLRVRDCCSSDIALDQSLIRPGLGYALTDQSTVWIGYARVTNYLDGQGRDRRKQGVGAINICGQDRRLSATLPSDHGWNNAGKQTVLIPARASVNFSNSPGQSLSFRVQISWSWDEAFVNLYDTDWGPRLQTHLGLDQNRGFVGIGYRFSPEIKTEIGYMNQYIQTHSTANDRVNHILSVWLFFDLYKK